MIPRVFGTICGAVVALLVLRFPLRRYVQTWWGSVCFAMIFLTAGPAIAEAVHARRLSVGQYWQEIAIVVVAAILAAAGTRRRE